MAKMIVGAINRLRVASILFRGEPGRWQTRDGRFEVIRVFVPVDGYDGETIAMWGVWDNADGVWLGTTDTNYPFLTMRDAVHELKAIMMEEDL